MTREEIYDNEINPLMAQIIAICTQNGIPFVSSFALDKDEDGNHLFCSSSLLLEELDPPESLLDAMRCIRGPPRSIAMITVRDGAGNVKSSTAVEQ